jgi:hypothetical protein
MAAMSATTTSGGAKPHVTPSFYVGGGFGPDDEEYGDFMMSSICKYLEPNGGTKGYSARSKFKPGSTAW